MPRCSYQWYSYHRPAIAYEPFVFGEGIHDPPQKQCFWSDAFTDAVHTAHHGAVARGEPLRHGCNQRVAGEPVTFGNQEYPGAKLSERSQGPQQSRALIE